MQTPLHLAVILDKPSIVQLLLMKGAHPGIQDKDGNTAVHLAVLKKRYMCLAVLLSKQTYGGWRVSNDFADILNYNGIYIDYERYMQIRTFITFSRL